MRDQKLTVVRMPISDVYIVGERRSVNADTVAALASSFQSIGQRTPITVRFVPDFTDDDGDDIGTVNGLVTGRHRIEAAKSLGWTHIDAVYMDGDETDARLWEISENLHRAELTALERDEQVAEWVRLTVKKQEDTAREKKASEELALEAPKPVQSEQVSKGGRGLNGGISAASKELGISRPDAIRATQVASLTPSAKQTARDLGLDDNRSALLEAAKGTTEAEQVAILERRASPPPPLSPPPDPFLHRLIRAWEDAPDPARSAFLKFTEGWAPGA